MELQSLLESTPTADDITDAGAAVNGCHAAVPGSSGARVDVEAATRIASENIIIIVQQILACARRIFEFLCRLSK